MRLECARVKPHFRGFQRLAIAKLPLPGLPRDPQRDVTFQRVPRQDDLGARPVHQHRCKNAWVMIMKEPKTRQAICRGTQLGQKHKGVGLARDQRHAEHLNLIFFADERRVEHFAVTGDPRKGIQIRFQKIRSCPHPGQHNKIVKTRFCQDSFHQIGPRPSRSDWS